ncbi:MAG TPA: bacteriohemerythrin [Firmicutes bacterium]|nr:bacteriohemerythrin [Bacillota bacterium]
MGYIQWKDSLTVYNNFLDEQHRKMIEAVNELHAEYMLGRDARDMNHHLTDLSALTRTHFQTEEIMMHATQYPGLERHKAEHQQLLADMDTIVGELTRGERELTEELFEFLHHWVEGHIRSEDREFGQHLLEFIQEHPNAELPNAETRLSS